MQRFEARAALAEALRKSNLKPLEVMAFHTALALRPKKRRAILDAVEEHLVLSGLVLDTEEGLIVNLAEAEDGTYGSAWLLIIQALIAFLPMLLELLNR